MKKLYFLLIVALAVPYYAQAPWFPDEPVKPVPVMTGVEQTTLDENKELVAWCFDIIKDRVPAEDLIELVQDDLNARPNCTIVMKLKALIPILQRVQETDEFKIRLTTLEDFLKLVKNITKEIQER